jgi:hypothetical protein
MVKVVLLLGGLLAAALITALVLYFYRIGSPVDAQRSRHYFHHAWKNKIVYAPMGNWFELAYVELETEPDSFRVLAEEFGTDGRTVFWKGVSQSADAATFRLGNGFAADGHTAYYLGGSYAEHMKPIAGSDPASFQPFLVEDERTQLEWHRDTNVIYFRGERLPVEVGTFTRLRETFAWDSQHIYTFHLDSHLVWQWTQQEPNPGGHIESLTPHYLRQGNALVHASFWNPYARVAFPKIDSVRVLDPGIVVVDQQLVYWGRVVAGADVATVQLIDHLFFKDAERVFFRGQLIPNAEPASFEVIYDTYSRDRQQVFFETTALPELRPAQTVVKFDRGKAYVTDGVRSYRGTKEISISN